MPTRSPLLRTEVAIRVVDLLRLDATVKVDVDVFRDGVGLSILGDDTPEIVTAISVALDQALHEASAGIRVEAPSEQALAEMRRRAQEGVDRVRQRPEPAQVDLVEDEDRHFGGPLGQVYAWADGGKAALGDQAGIDSDFTRGYEACLDRVLVLLDRIGDR